MPNREQFTDGTTATLLTCLFVNIIKIKSLANSLATLSKLYIVGSLSSPLIRVQ